MNRKALTDLPVKTLTDLPDFIFLDHMMEYLDIGAVGALIMVSSILRDIFDKNEEEIWKILYLRTLPYKILDTSIHIGEHDQSLNDTQLSKLCKVCSPQYWSHLNGTYANSLKFSPGCLWGISNQKAYGFKSIKELRASPEGQTVFGNDWAVPIKDTCKIYDLNFGTRVQYYEHCFSVHKELNNEDGCSTVQLCRNPTHYIEKTLGRHENKTISRHHKELTLKKFLTKKKKAIKSDNDNIDNQNLWISMKEEGIRKLEKKIAEYDKEKKRLEKHREITKRCESNLKKALEVVKKIKKKPSGKTSKKNAN